MTRRKKIHVSKSLNYPERDLRKKNHINNTWLNGCHGNDFKIILNYEIKILFDFFLRQQY